MSTTLNPLGELDSFQRDELGRCLGHAVKLARLLAVTPHDPALLFLLRDLVIDAENMWLILGEDSTRRAPSHDYPRPPRAPTRRPKVGSHRWTARCPAHEDRSPSLSIRNTDDGKILFHCFRGCAPDDILAALGLTWKDLYPEDRWREAEARALAHGHRRLQKTMAEITQADYARQVLLIAAADLRAGKTHSLEDKATLALAVEILEQERAHG